MTTKDVNKQMTRWYQFMLIAGIILISFNLRPAITAVGPLLGIIRDDVALANSTAGLLTSLPLVAFAVMSPFAARIGNRYSYEGAMLIGLIILLIGMTIRSASVLVLLFAGTFLAGLGIAILNVLLPGIIKDKFPLKVGIMTSIYSTTMGIIASIASGVSIPLAEYRGFGWQGSLMIWVIPTVVAIVVWFYLRKKSKENTKQLDEQEMRYASPSDRKIWRSPLAWQIAAFMGLQSFTFYVTISWLPEILHATAGMTMEAAGWMLSFTQFIGLPASFLVPVLAERSKSQRWLVIILTLCSFLGYGGLLLANNIVFIVICTILIGINLSGVFALALTLFPLRTRTARDAANLSGMAQSIGYVLAALGPVFIGFLYDLSGDWIAPVIAIMVVSLILGFFGMLIGKERYLFE